ncbi:MAG: alginate export family protein, partial [Acidobacteriota bacterium]
MRKICLLSAALCLFAATLSDPLRAEEPEQPRTFGEALTGGTAKVSLRYRFEAVDDDAFEDTAEASTLRTTLSYFTAEWRGWSAFAEAENVAGVFDDDGYNNAGSGSLNNGVRGVPVVADPEITVINQAFARFRNDRLKVTLGRQAINLGDQRFVGAVAWRQHHQTFDAARLEVDTGSWLKLDYTFATRVNRIVGNRLDFESHFLFVPMSFGGDQRLTAYGFYLDYEEALLASTSTYGLEYKGKFALGDRSSLSLELEAAEQRDVGDNPLEIDTQYLLATLGFDVGAVGFDASWEVLGGSDGGQRS